MKINPVGGFISVRIIDIFQNSLILGKIEVIGSSVNSEGDKWLTDCEVNEVVLFQQSDCFLIESSIFEIGKIGFIHQEYIIGKIKNNIENNIDELEIIKEINDLLNNNNNTCK